jgi:hypothetical protein
MLRNSSRIAWTLVSPLRAAASTASSWVLAEIKCSSPSTTKAERNSEKSGFEVTLPRPERRAGHTVFLARAG